MTTYTVYHLHGRKYGCTCDLPERIKDYPHHQLRMMEIIAVLDDIAEAEALELKLNKAAGYPHQHVKYTHAIAIAPLGGRASRGGRLTPEQRRALGRKGGLIGGRTAMQRGVGIFGLSPEERAAAGRKGRQRAAETRDHQRLAEQGSRLGSMRAVCEICGYENNLGNLARHRSRCRANK